MRDGFGGRIFAPDAGDAKIEPMIVGKRAFAHEGRVDGNVELLGERLQLVVSATDPHAAAGKDQAVAGRW